MTFWCFLQRSTEAGRRGQTGQRAVRIAISTGEGLVPAHRRPMVDNTAQDQICKIETARWDIAKVRSNDGHCARGRIRSIFVSLYYSWRIRRSSWIIFMIGMRRDFLMNFLNWRFQFHSTFYVRIPLRLHQSNNSANWRKSRLGFPRKHDVHHQHFFLLDFKQIPRVWLIFCVIYVYTIFWAKILVRWTTSQSACHASTWCQCHHSPGALRCWQNFIHIFFKAEFSQEKTCLGWARGYHIYQTFAKQIFTSAWFFFWPSPIDKSWWDFWFRAHSLNKKEIKEAAWQYGKESTMKDAQSNI